MKSRAIKVLEKRISDLNKEIQKTQKSLDEPEMLSDYEYGINHIGNCEGEIIELQEAIQILTKQ